MKPNTPQTRIHIKRNMSKAYVKEQISNGIATIEFFHPEHNSLPSDVLANLAQTINVLQAVILTDEERMILTPTYHVMKMYNVHQDAKLIPTELRDNPTYELDGKSLPAVSVSASVNESGVVHVSLVNIHSTQAQNVRVMLRGTENSKASGQILASDQIQDYNSFDEPTKIQPTDFKDFKLKNGELSVELPPFSVVVLKIEN